MTKETKLMTAMKATEEKKTTTNKKIV